MLLQPSPLQPRHFNPCYFNLATSTSLLQPRHFNPCYFNPCYFNLATSTLATSTSPLQPRHFNLTTSTLATSTSPLQPHHSNPCYFNLATSTSPLQPRHFNPCYFNLATSTLATSTSPLQPRHFNPCYFNLATSTSQLQPRHFNLINYIYTSHHGIAVSWSSKLASWGSPDLVSTNRWLQGRGVMECIETIEGLPDTVTAIILQYTPTRYHPLGEFLPPCVYGCGSNLLLNSMDCCVSGVSTYIAEPIQVHIAHTHSVCLR